MNVALHRLHPRDTGYFDTIERLHAFVLREQSHAVLVGTFSRFEDEYDFQILN